MCYESIQCRQLRELVKNDSTNQSIYTIMNYEDILTLCEQEHPALIYVAIGCAAVPPPIYGEQMMYVSCPCERVSIMIILKRPDS